MQQFTPPAGPLMQHTGNTTETCLYGINPIYHHVPRLCYSHPPPTFIISQLPLHPVYFFPGWPKSGAGFGGFVRSVDFAVGWGQRTLWFLILFLFKEQVRTLVEAALINSEINKEGCSYAFLQMCRRFIDRLWAVQYFYLCIVPLSFPKWGVSVIPLLPLISTMWHLLLSTQWAGSWNLLMLRRGAAQTEDFGFFLLIFFNAH